MLPLDESSDEEVGNRHFQDAGWSYKIPYMFYGVKDGMLGEEDVLTVRLFPCFFGLAIVQVIHSSNDIYCISLTWYKL